METDEQLDQIQQVINWSESTNEQLVRNLVIYCLMVCKQPLVSEFGIKVGKLQQQQLM
jgi:hypothetical protein